MFNPALGLTENAFLLCNGENWGDSLGIAFKIGVPHSKICKWVESHPNYQAMISRLDIGLGLSYDNGSTPIYLLSDSIYWYIEMKARMFSVTPQ